MNDLTYGLSFYIFHSHFKVYTAEETEVMFVDNNVKEYQIGNKYKKGDEIFHPVFKEQGKITGVEQLPNGTQKIMVRFEKSGEKKLISGIKQSSQ